MPDTAHETPKAKGMTRTWGAVALIVVLVVLALAWFFGLFDGEPAGTVLSESPELAAPLADGARAG